MDELAQTGLGVTDVILNCWACVPVKCSNEMIRMNRNSRIGEIIKAERAWKPMKKIAYLFLEIRKVKQFQTDGRRICQSSHMPYIG